VLQHALYTSTGKKWRKRRQLLPLMVFSIILTFFLSSPPHWWFLPSFPFSPPSAFSISTFLWTHQHFHLFLFQVPRSRGEKRPRDSTADSLCLVSLFRRWDKSFQRAKLCKLFMERQIRRRFSFVRMETAIRVTPIAVFFLHRKRGALVQFLFPFCVSFFIILFSLPPVSNFW